jgi:hypothetical protein
MNISFFQNKFRTRILLFFFLATFGVSAVVAQNSGASLSGSEIYNQLKAFSLSGGSAEVSGLVLKRDRATMIFNGTFYFSAPIGGRVTGAVFIGQGTFQAPVPPSDFEKNNVKRLLNADTVQSDFKTAVLRFTDDTFEVIGKDKRDALPTEQARNLASAIEPRILKETGVNISSRLALSIINRENPGSFSPISTAENSTVSAFFLTGKLAFRPLFSMSMPERKVLSSHINPSLISMKYGWLFIA